ncbi:MAG: DegV family protein, partial [Oscillospiraceae bacterium]
RVSAATAVLGTMLSIKPVMHVDDEGRLINMAKARGRKASMVALVDNMEKTAIDPANQMVFLSHGDCLEDAQKVADMVKERMGVKEVILNNVGPVIGAHSGPGTLALFFLGTER